MVDEPLDEASDITTLRQQMQAAAPGLGPAIIDTLSAAMQAHKRVRITEPCGKCGCGHVRIVEIQDATAAASAAKVFIEAVQGRPGVSADGDAEPSVIVRRVGLAQS